MSDRPLPPTEEPAATLPASDGCTNAIGNVSDWERVEQVWDSEGRGVLLREFHRRCGFDPRNQAAGFASFARALDRSRLTGREFPEQFRETLSAAVAAVVGPVLEARRRELLAEVEAAVGVLVGQRLDGVRQAFLKLNAEVVELRAEVVELRRQVRGRQMAPSGR